MYFDGGIIANVTASLTAGTMEISQSVTVNIATLMA